MISWSARLDIDPAAFAWKISKGEFLTFVASLALAQINKLTDDSRDYMGNKFEPRDYNTIKRDENGLAIRDAKGRWQVVRVTEDNPTLRSNKRVKPGKRMRDNIVVLPKKINPDARQVTIRASSGRKDPNSAYFTHQMRAAYASGYRSDSIYRRTDFRIFINLSERSVAIIRSKLSEVGAIAFLKNHYTAIARVNVARAVAKQRRVRAAIERAARRDAQRETAKHNAMIERARAEGLIDNFSLRDAYYALRQQKRIERRYKKKNPTSAKKKKKQRK